MSIFIPPREFSRSAHEAPQTDRRTRIVAALLTGGLYGVLALLAWWPLSRTRAPAEPPEMTAILVPDALARREPPPPLAHLVKPHAENPAPPEIIMTPETSPQLSASKAEISPLAGGQSGGASGTGSGNGDTAAGCLDAAWMRAVTARVRQFFVYPPAALAVRRTGVVMVHFAVRRNGEIESLRIGKSSGDPELDQAALEIMKNAGPLPAIPERMHTDRVEGEMPINFGVRGFGGNTPTGTCGG